MASFWAALGVRDPSVCVCFVSRFQPASRALFLNRGSGGQVLRTPNLNAKDGIDSITSSQHTSRRNVSARGHTRRDPRDLQFSESALPPWQGWPLGPRESRAGRSSRYCSCVGRRAAESKYSLNRGLAEQKNPGSTTHKLTCSARLGAFVYWLSGDVSYGPHLPQRASLSHSLSTDRIQGQDMFELPNAKRHVLDSFLSLAPSPRRDPFSFFPLPTPPPPSQTSPPPPRATRTTS